MRMESGAPADRSWENTGLAKMRTSNIWRRTACWLGGWVRFMHGPFVDDVGHPFCPGLEEEQARRSCGKLPPHFRLNRLDLLLQRPFAASPPVALDRAAHAVAV